MDHQSSAGNSKIDMDRSCIEELRDTLIQFDPSKLSLSWSPEIGSEVVSSLNALADSLQKKSEEIKNYLRKVTIEELNDIDGFDRCNVAQPPPAMPAQPRP